jgi:hypothetical protein
MYGMLGSTIRKDQRSIKLLSFFLFLSLSMGILGLWPSRGPWIATDWAIKKPLLWGLVFWGCALVLRSHEQENYQYNNRTCSRAYCEAKPETFHKFIFIVIHIKKGGLIPISFRAIPVSCAFANPRSH